MNKEEILIALKEIHARYCIPAREQNYTDKDYACMQYEKLVIHLANQLDRLNNIINETRRVLGQYAHYSTPTEEQNAKNEAIVDEAYIQLHGNVAKELKEGNK